MAPGTISRRTFVAGMGKAVVAAAVAPAVIASCSPKNSAPAAPKNTITLDVTDSRYAALATVGGALYYPDPNDDSAHPMIVCRVSQNEVAAFVSRCTHQGGTVALPVNGTITCPLHGSTFDNRGHLLGGPATTGLGAYPASIQGNTITIQA